MGLVSSELHVGAVVCYDVVVAMLIPTNERCRSSSMIDDLHLHDDTRRLDIAYIQSSSFRWNPKFKMVGKRSDHNTNIKSEQNLDRGIRLLVI